MKYPMESILCRVFQFILERGIDSATINLSSVYMLFQGRFTTVLKQMAAGLDALEPDPSGYIQEHFLEGEIEQVLRHIAQLTGSLTDEANSIMNQVAEIVSLPHINDSEVQYGVRDATIKRDATVTQLHEFDANQTTALTPIAQVLPTMETWISDIESMFREGLTDVHFESNQWAAITLNSGLKTTIGLQTSAVASGLGNSDQDNLIGTEITAGAFRTLESKRTETVERGAYGSYNLLKFHIYENGLIIKEYQLGTRKPIQYEVVKEVEEEFDDVGVRELDSIFEGTALAFVDYIHPKGILQKGFKKMALAFIPGAKPVKYKGNISGKKTSTVGEKPKGTDNPRTRLPRSNGHWEGEPGNGKWYSDKPEVKNITNGEGVEFAKNRPNFTPWTEGNIVLEKGKLTGTSDDFSLVYEKIQQQFNLPSKNAAKKLLKQAGVTPHHKSSTEIELIPTDLHGNVPHIGSASDLRGGY